MEMAATGQIRGTISEIISHDKSLSFLRLFIDSDDIQQIITAEFLFKVAEMKKQASVDKVKYLLNAYDLKRRHGHRDTICRLPKYQFKEVYKYL